MTNNVMSFDERARMDALAQAIYDHTCEIAGISPMTWDQLCVDDPEIMALYHCEAQSIISRIGKAGWNVVRGQVSAQDNHNTAPSVQQGDDA